MIFSLRTPNKPNFVFCSYRQIFLKQTLRQLRFELLDNCYSGCLNDLSLMIVAEIRQFLSDLFFNLPLFLRRMLYLKSRNLFYYKVVVSMYMRYLTAIIFPLGVVCLFILSLLGFRPLCDCFSFFPNMNHFMEL